MRFFWLAVIPACVATVDGLYVAGDDVDTEDTAPHADSNGPVTFDNSHADYVDWHNDQGTFRIYKQCVGFSRGITAGPGYIATVWNRNGQIVVDDTTVPIEKGPNSGATGLGMFGLHLLRVPVGSKATATRVKDQYDYTHQLAGRWCNADKPADENYGGYRGWGVRTWSIVEAPKVSGNIGELAIDVILADGVSDLVDVRYTYRIGSDYVKQWIRVTNQCSDGTCDPATIAYVKEPKVIAGVNPSEPDAVGIEQMNTFNDTGHTGTGDKVNHWNAEGCSSSPAGTHLCEWGGRDPRANDGGGTGQCSDPERRRVRFWNPHLACAADPSCLVIAARGADTELGPSYPWQGPHGLDLWAQRNVSEGRAQFATQDTTADGFLEKNNCWNNSAATQNRRWEMAGFAKTQACGYTTALAAFHGWEGGTGTYDCEPLYYRFGHAPESYVVAMSYGFGAAPLP